MTLFENTNQIDLLLFTPDPEFARQAEAAGINGIIIDWEQKDKGDRQQKYDTEINKDTVEDLQHIRAAVSLPVTVRINGLHPETEDEINSAVDNGADVIMLPMAESAADVEKFMALLDDRAQAIIQIETQSLVEQCEELRSLPWDAAYIGLNDLMISRGADSLWTPLIDGTIEHIYSVLSGRRVGFGGITIIGGGAPIPFTGLLREMAYYNCDLSFLRRTFRKEIEGRSIQDEIAAVRAAWTAARSRSELVSETDHLAFRQFLIKHLNVESE